MPEENTNTSTKSQSPQAIMSKVNKDTNGILDPKVVQKEEETIFEESVGIKNTSENIFLSWKDLKEEHIRAIRKLNNLDAIRTYLKELLKLDQLYPLEVSDTLSAEVVRGNGVRREIFLDLSCSILAFCLKNHFTLLKTSTCFSIIKTLHRACCEIPGCPMSLPDAYKLFEDLLLKHSVPRPPFSIHIFDYNDINAITTFTTNTYFRHIKMYQYVFGQRNLLQLNVSVSAASSVAPMSSIPPLSSAVKTEEVIRAPVIPEPEPEPVQEPEPEPEDPLMERVNFNAPAIPTLDKLDEEDKAKFQTALAHELGKMQTELADKMAEQAKAFQR